MRKVRGLTLVELLTTIGVVAILSTLAAPSFANLLSNSERTTTVNRFFPRFVPGSQRVHQTGHGRQSLQIDRRLDLHTSRRRMDSGVARVRQFGSGRTARARSRRAHPRQL